MASNPSIVTAASRGAEHDPTHFYSTSYSRMAGNVGPAQRPLRHSVDVSNPKARNTRAAGVPGSNGVGLTGYTANFRPAVGYSRTVDEIDGNETMARHCHPDLAFATRTKRDYTARSRAQDDETEKGSAPAPLRARPEQIEGLKPAGKASGRLDRPNTLPTPADIQAAKRVSSARPYATETKDRFVEKPIHPEHPVPEPVEMREAGGEGGRGGGPAVRRRQQQQQQPSLAAGKPTLLHESRTSAFVRDVPAGDTITEAKPVAYTLGETRESGAGVSTTRQEFATVAANVPPPAGAERIGDVVQERSPFVFGTRARPYYMPNDPSGSVVGAPVALLPQVTERIRRTHPIEYLNRTNPRVTQSMTATLHPDVHGMGTAEREALSAPGVVIGPKQKSGFALNVDTAPPSTRDPGAGSRFRTEMKDTVGAPRAATKEVDPLRARQHDSNFALQTSISGFQNSIREDLALQRPEVVERLVARDPFLVDNTHARKGAFW